MYFQETKHLKKHFYYIPEQAKIILFIYIFK